MGLYSRPHRGHCMPPILAFAGMTTVLKNKELIKSSCHTSVDTMDPDLRRGDDKAHTHRHTGDGRYPLQKHHTTRKRHYSPPVILGGVPRIQVMDANKKHPATGGVWAQKNPPEYIGGDVYQFKVKPVWQSSEKLHVPVVSENSSSAGM